MRTLLFKMEQEGKREVEVWEENEFSNDLISAGVGFYYFEDIERKKL